MALIAFVVIPQDGTDWVDNARITGGVVVWLAAVAAALAILSRIRLRKADGDRQAVTAGSLVARLFHYMIADPILRAFRNAMGEVIEWKLGPLRDENTSQHAETSDRLSEVERAVSVLSERIQAVEDVLTTPPPP